MKKLFTLPAILTMIMIPLIFIMWYQILTEYMFYGISSILVGFSITIVFIALVKQTFFTKQNNDPTE